MGSLLQKRYVETDFNILSMSGDQCVIFIFEPTVWFRGFSALELNGFVLARGRCQWRKALGVLPSNSRPINVLLSEPELIIGPKAIIFSSRPN